MARDKIIQFKKIIKPKQSLSKGYALYNEGKCLYNQNKDDLAFKKFLEAEKLGFESDDMYACMAWLVGRDSQKTDKVLEYINKAIELDSENSYAHYLKGYTLESIGQYSEALSCLLKAEELHYDSPYLYTKISYCYEQIGEELKSIAYASKAIKKYPNEIDCYRRKAWVYFSHNNNEEALKYFLEAEKLGDTSNFYQISYCYSELENHKKALAYANKSIIADRNNFYGYYRKGFVYYMSEKYEKALENFLKSVSLIKEEAAEVYDMYPRISWIYQNIKGDIENAKKYAKISIDIMPDYDFAQYRMGCIYLYADKNYKEAAKYFKKALALKMGETDIYVYYDVGKNYFSMKKYAQALKYVEMGLSIQPENLGLCSVKISILYKQRKYEEVRALLQQALEKYPDDIWVQQANAMILAHFKQFDDSVKILETIRKDLQEVNVYALFVLANCYFKKKEYEKSLETFLEYSQKEYLEYLEKQDIRSIRSFIKKLSKLFPNDERLVQIESNFSNVLNPKVEEL